MRRVEAVGGLVCTAAQAILPTNAWSPRLADQSLHGAPCFGLHASLKCLEHKLIHTKEICTHLRLMNPHNTSQQTTVMLHAELTRLVEQVVAAGPAAAVGPAHHFRPLRRARGRTQRLQNERHARHCLAQPLRRSTQRGWHRRFATICHAICARKPCPAIKEGRHTAQSLYCWRLDRFGSSDCFRVSLTAHRSEGAHISRGSGHNHTLQAFRDLRGPTRRLTARSVAGRARLQRLQRLHSRELQGFG